MVYFYPDVETISMSIERQFLLYLYLYISYIPLYKNSFNNVNFINIEFEFSSSILVRIIPRFLDRVADKSLEKEIQEILYGMEKVRGQICCTPNFVLLFIIFVPQTSVDSAEEGSFLDQLLNDKYIFRTRQYCVHVQKKNFYNDHEPIFEP